MRLWEQWGRVASRLWYEIGQPPACSIAIAEACGLSVYPAEIVGARRFADAIEVDASADRLLAHEMIAHEVGHWALRRARARNTEAGATYVGTALLLPEKPFTRDLYRHGLDLEALRAGRPNCSDALIVRRCVEIYPRVARQRRDASGLVCVGLLPQRSDVA